MMNVVIRRQRKRFIHLLEHSGRHFAWVLGLLTVSLLGHWPSQDILVGGQHWGSGCCSSRYGFFAVASTWPD